MRIPADARPCASGLAFPGLCEAWMPNASLQGRIHGGSRKGQPAGTPHQISCTSEQHQPCPPTLLRRLPPGKRLKILNPLINGQIVKQ